MINFSTIEVVGGEKQVHDELTIRTVLSIALLEGREFRKHLPIELLVEKLNEKEREKEKKRKN